MVELSRSFECVYVEIGANLHLAKEHSTRFLAVVLFDEEGRELGRYAPENIYTKGDPAVLAERMKAALEEIKKPRPVIPLPAEGRELIGEPAKEWKPSLWLRGEPGKLEALEGKVVLVRFFTVDCPFCARTMPALEKLHRKYGERGLTVVGFFHPKPKGAVKTAREIEEALEEWKVTFPIALDTEWKTVEGWWLKNKRRRATSASFLIDRRGKIRFVHPGPEIQPEMKREYGDLVSAIETLLAE